MTSIHSQSAEDDDRYFGVGGPYQALSLLETKWRDRQQFLESKGYMLRPRLRPGWTPSWLETGIHWRRAEDSAELPGRPNLVDATRIADGKLVYIKEVRTGDEESRFALILGSHQDATNHSVPILDSFVDSTNESISYLVMPFLRLFDDPPFESIGEILDFADQILEGLAFMHSKGIAHRDCSPKNIMMDAANMYPLGFHPVMDLFLHDVTTTAPIIPRSMVGVKYYFVDYGISSYFPSESQERLVLGTQGRDQNVPELSNSVPYDPFKVDIFSIGNVFRRLFRDKYSNCHFFTPIIESMMQTNPADRPTAVEVLEQWRSVRSQVQLPHRLWRPREHDEALFSIVLLDVVYIFSSFAHTIRFLGRIVRSSVA